MDISNLILLLWSALAFWVVGQIWFAQRVIYPLFGLVDDDTYLPYHRFYLSRIPLPVIIPGFASFFARLVVAVFGPAVPVWMTMTNIVAGVVSFMVTVGLEIPRHRRLETQGKNDVVIAELVRFNWPRTLAMSTQAIVTVLMLCHAFGAA